MMPLTNYNMLQGFQVSIPLFPFYWSYSLIYYFLVFLQARSFNGQPEHSEQLYVYDSMANILYQFSSCHLSRILSVTRVILKVIIMCIFCAAVLLQLPLIVIIWIPT